jgi:hypothetical protein
MFVGLAILNWNTISHKRIQKMCPMFGVRGGVVEKHNLINFFSSLSSVNTELPILVPYRYFAKNLAKKVRVVKYLESVRNVFVMRF